MHKLLSDPLIHFLLIGAVLFAVLARYGSESDPQQIVVSADQVRSALRSRMLPAEDMPSRAQLESLIEPLIRDEVYYREALALGLDTDDDQVRTRLIEKMRYVTEDLADPEPADEAQLRALYDADPERFAVPESVTFEQVFFNPSERGDSVGSDARRALAALRRGADSAGQGDSTPLGDSFTSATRERLGILFGEPMTSSLFDLAPNVWSGPFESDFGLHLVRVGARSPARQPPFEEVRDQVRDAFAADNRARRNAAAWEALRDRYDVVVAWPEELGISN